MNVTLKSCCALGRCPAVTDLKACSACSEVVYCCKDHQIEHFKEGGHKMVCPGRQKGSPLTFQQCAEKAQEYHSGQMWNAALPYYGGMLELSQRVLGLGHPQVGNILNVISTIYRMTGKIEFAIACLQKQLVVKHLTDRGTTDEYKEAFTIMGLMAELYLQLDNVPLAKEMLIKAEEIAIKEFGEDSFERGRCLVALAACHEKSEERVEAEDCLRRAVALSGYGSPSDPASMHAASNGFFNLAVILISQQQMNKLEEAVVYLRRTADLRRSAGLSEEHPDIANIVAAIASCEADILEGPIPQQVAVEKSESTTDSVTVDTVATPSTT